jgi:hypothetical protein
VEDVAAVELPARSVDTGEDVSSELGVTYFVLSSQSAPWADPLIVEFGGPDAGYTGGATCCCHERSARTAGTGDGRKIGSPTAEAILLCAGDDTDAFGATIEEAAAVAETASDADEEDALDDTTGRGAGRLCCVGEFEKCGDTVARTAIS